MLGRFRDVEKLGLAVLEHPAVEEVGNHKEQEGSQEEDTHNLHAVKNYNSTMLEPGGGVP